MLLLDGFQTGRVGLLVPDLFWIEIGSILWKAARKNRISENTAFDGSSQLNNSGISTAATRHLVEDALKIAIAFDRSIYDSVYLALAIERGRILITADERLVRAVASRLPVRWLGSLVLS